MSRKPSAGIVCGFDGTSSGEDGVALAVLLASMTGASVTAVVVVPTDTSVTAARLDAELAQLASRGGEVAARASEILGASGVPFTVERVTARSAARGLDEVVRRGDVRLVVLGSTRRGPLGRVFPGATGERLLHGCPVPVAVAPHGYSGRGAAPLTSIAVAYLSARDSEPALAAGADLARRLGTPLRVLTVVNRPDSAPPLPALQAAREFDAARRAAFQRELEFALAGVHPDIEVAGELVVADDPVEVLAALDDVDLLVCASRGYGPVRAVLLGDVSSALLHRAAFPVLVVPRGGTA